MPPDVSALTLFNTYANIINTVSGCHIPHFSEANQSAVTIINCHEQEIKDHSRHKLRRRQPGQRCQRPGQTGIQSHCNQFQSRKYSRRMQYSFPVWAQPATRWKAWKPRAWPLRSGRWSRYSGRCLPSAWVCRCYYRSPKRRRTQCLGIVPGKVRKLPQGLKIPHMGWNQVKTGCQPPVFHRHPG